MPNLGLVLGAYPNDLGLRLLNAKGAVVSMDRLYKSAKCEDMDLICLPKLRAQNAVGEIEDQAEEDKHLGR